MCVAFLFTYTGMLMVELLQWLISQLVRDHNSCSSKYASIFQCQVVLLHKECAQIVINSGWPILTNMSIHNTQHFVSMCCLLYSSNGKSLYLTHIEYRRLCGVSFGANTVVCFEMFLNTMKFISRQSNCNLAAVMECI